MDSLLLIFILACSSSLLWPELPSLLWLIPTWTFILYLGCKLKSEPFYKVASACTGIVWMASVGYWDAYWQLPQQYYQQTVTVSGEIQTLVSDQNMVRFNFAADQVGSQSYLFNPPLLRLSWYQPDWVLQQGQKVTLQVKLKPRSGLANHYGFNYQQWLFSQQMVATGYVKSHGLNELSINYISFRQQLLNGILSQDLDTAGWILALAIGYRGLMEQADWELLQHTGTAHLVAISGLHIGMIAAASYFVFGMTLGLASSALNLHNRLNVHSLALGASVLVSLCYAWIAGFSLPTLRAVIMLVLFWLLTRLGWRWSFKRMLLVGMTLVILLFPFSLFTISFWFSFCAVAFIGFIFWRWPVDGKTFSIKNNVKIALRMQLGLSLLMLPLVASQMGIISFSAPLINLFAVPIMTLLLLPCTFVATLLLAAGWEVNVWLFHWLDQAFVWFLEALNMLNVDGLAVIKVPGISLYAWIALFGAMVFCLLPVSRLSRLVALVLCFPWVSELLAKSGEWQVNVLDVGQGLSVLITQGNTYTLYDTGAAFPGGFNMADAAIIPTLKGLGRTDIDRVILSHGDIDHSGSYQDLIESITVHETLSWDDGCIAPKSWQEGKLRWKILWPLSVTNTGSLSDNDSSCVVKVSNGEYSLLLTGDIELPAEEQILEHYRADLSILKSDILIAPHHGSKTSSSVAFVQAVQPQIVIFSQGINNRWGLPHQEVIERYQQMGAKTYKTSESGQISVTFTPQLAVTETRKHVRSYWYANN